MPIEDQVLQAIPKDLLLPHPVLPLPTREQLLAAVDRGQQGIAELEHMLRQRAELIRLEREDPFRHLFCPPCFKDFEQLVARGFKLIYVGGANREGKTTEVVNWLVRRMFTQKTKVAFFHSTEKTSIHQQQKNVFRMMPAEFRARFLHKAIKKPFKGSTQAAYLSYNEATGFSNDVFIIPTTGSQGFFFNYGQPNSVWEGDEYDIIYFEEKVELPILETAKLRLMPGNPVLIIVNFTPVWGYTPVYQNLLAGAKITATRPAPLLERELVHVKGCPPGEMPYILEGPKPNQAAILFHNSMNPMGAGREVADQLRGTPKSRIMIRGYGWAEKGASGAFPKFGAAHIVTRQAWERIRIGRGTHYCISDPGSAGKNWFFQWWFATVDGWHILWKEWPDRTRYEEWAVSPAQMDSSDDAASARRHDWRRGPAQRLEAGRSIASYKALLLTEEGFSYDPAARQWVPGKNAVQVHRRLMDPAFGGTEVPSAEEGVTPIELMGERDQRDSEGRTVPPMYWEQSARGSGSGQGFKADRSQFIADLMDWNENAPLSGTNCPKLYVVEDCLQSIEAFREYVPPPWSTNKNALCEPIDCAGYYAVSGCNYVDPVLIKVRAGGWW